MQTFNAARVDNSIALQALMLQHDPRQVCLLTVQSKFVSKVIQSFVNQRNLLWRIETERKIGRTYHVHFGEYEDIDWDLVLAGENRERANCYCVRKGLTRKGAWAQVVNKWCVYLSVTQNMHSLTVNSG